LRAWELAKTAIPAYHHSGFRGSWIIKIKETGEKIPATIVDPFKGHETFMEGGIERARSWEGERKIFCWRDYLRNPE
jgi:hypothetical protein